MPNKNSSMVILMNLYDKVVFSNDVTVVSYLSYLLLNIKYQSEFFAICESLYVCTFLIYSCYRDNKIVSLQENQHNDKDKMEYIHRTETNKVKLINKVNIFFTRYAT